MRILVVLGLMSLFGCAARSSGEPTRAESLRYLALGDSYTIGEDASPPERWPVQLAVLLRQRGIAVGEPEIIARTGWTVAELSAGVDAAAPRGPCDPVTLPLRPNGHHHAADPAS